MIERRKVKTLFINGMFRAGLVPATHYKSVVKRLDATDKLIDWHFRNATDQYMQEVLRPNALAIKKGDYKGKIIEKRYNSHQSPTKGLTAYQRFFIELDCLTRINIEMEKANISDHFPILMDFNENSLEMKFSHNGTSLDNLKSDIIIKNVFEQIDLIVAILNSADVVHLDIALDGRNVCVNANGFMSVIDFDFACCGKKAADPRIEAALASTISMKTQILDVIRKNHFIKVK